MLREFDGQMQRIEAERVDAGIEQRLAEPRALLRRTAAADVA